MKKWLKIELFVLVALLAVALTVRIADTQDIFAPTKLQQAPTGQAETTHLTEPTTEETTLPPTMPEITWKELPADRALTARQAFVYDCQNEIFLYHTGLNSLNDKVYPASITKLFTAHVAMQYLSPEATVTAGEALSLIGEGSSIAQIWEGDVFTVEMLVQGMLLPSGNDAAYILATEAGRVLSEDATLSAAHAVERFVQEMNAQAQELGMTGTHFMNPDGYHDDNHYTTYKDLTVLARVALENETVMRYTSVSKATVKPVLGEQKEWINTNFMVDPESEYYCPYAVGLKTGQTEAAGSCLLSAFDIEGRYYVIGVFGCPEYTDRFDDTLQLFNEKVIAAG